MESNHILPSPEAATDEPASFLHQQAEDHPSSQANQLVVRDGADTLDFDPVSTRHRIDGWTPEKQREYVEALADTGLSRHAAALVGMTEQSAARLRRRADARSFDLACEAAVRIGARRIRSLAFERAIEGTIKRHYYHGELKSEERVYDNRLLVYLVGKLDRLLEPPEEALAVAENWQPWMEAIEQGLPAPPAPEPEEEEEEFTGNEVWEDSRGRWWTSFPPPADFAGEERDDRRRGYHRTLTAAEDAALDREAAEEEEETRRTQRARRDRYFGFEGGIFSPQGS